MTGALAGLRIIEIAGIGAAPFAGMMLADHGAEVIRIDRPGGTQGGVEIRRETDVLARSRRSIVIDLKSPAGIKVMQDLIGSADGLIESFRPGVMERLGLGPVEMLSVNPKLVYGRMTGWGQTGPYAKLAGHDLNYIAIAGALNGFGRAGQKPTPPINMVADFGGGGMVLAFGMLAGILSARSTGQGQVVDCSMTEGASVLMSMIWGLRAQGSWSDVRGTNALDTGSPYYDTFETSDGLHMAVGPVEPKFYLQLLERIGVAGDPAFLGQDDSTRWPGIKQALERFPINRKRSSFNFGEQFHPIILNLRFNMIGYCSN